jgi:hypothetical protein
MAQLAEAANSSWLTEPTATFAPNQPAPVEPAVQNTWEKTANDEVSQPIATTAGASGALNKQSLPKAAGQLPKSSGKLPTAGKAAAAAGMSLQEALQAARLAQR